MAEKALDTMMKQGFNSLNGAINIQMVHNTYSTM